MAAFGIFDGAADGDRELHLDDRDAVKAALCIPAADIPGDGEVNGAELAHVPGYGGVCSAL